MVAIIVDIEIYCETCGAGLCLETYGTEGKTRHEPQFRVNVCPTCIEKKDREIESLKFEIEGLKSEIQDLERKSS